MVTSFIRWVVIRTASCALPTIWWPVVLTRTGRCCPAAKATAAWTSDGLCATTMTAGTSSWFRLNTARSSSYPASPGSRTEPATAAMRVAASSRCTGGRDETSKVMTDILYFSCDRQERGEPDEGPEGLRFCPAPSGRAPGEWIASHPRWGRSTAGRAAYVLVDVILA